MIGNAEALARILRLPYFPVTPLFPWLGPVGAIPLPSNWLIEFCPPVTAGDFASDGQTDPSAVADLGGKVRDTIQQKLDRLVLERGPAFS